MERATIMVEYNLVHDGSEGVIRHEGSWEFGSIAEVNDTDEAILKECQRQTEIDLGDTGLLDVLELNQVSVAGYSGNAKFVNRAVWLMNGSLTDESI